MTVSEVIAALYEIDEIGRCIDENGFSVYSTNGTVRLKLRFKDGRIIFPSYGTFSYIISVFTVGQPVKDVKIPLDGGEGPVLILDGPIE